MAQEPLVERMRGFGTTIFAEMSALAIRTESINLGQGFPDTDGPPALLDAAIDAIRTGHNQYPPGPGVPELRAAIARHQQQQYALDWNADTEVLVTAGATEAIAATVLALAEAGSEVVVFEPYYDSYTACIALAGATRRTVTLRPGADGLWHFDPAELAAAITPRTRVLLLNTPHNPTGKIFDHSELALIARLAVDNDLLVVSDEVYEHLTFDGATHMPIASLPGMRERTVTIGSAGKTFSVTGWKIGWVTATPQLVGAVRTVKQFLTFVNGAPFQPAVAAALDGRLWGGLATQLQAQRDLLCGGLAELGFDVVPPQATYFATVDVHRNGVAFCRDLPHSAGVVAIPSSVFYDSDVGDSLVRFAFCKRPEVLREALLRLEKARDGHGQGDIMKVAAIQHDIVWEDAAATRAHVEPLIAQAVASGARLVVLTEMFATGFSMHPERIAEDEGGPTESFLADQARLHDVTLIASVAQRGPDGKYRNNAIVAVPDGPVRRYAKIHPFTYSREHEHYTAGDSFLTVDVDDLRVTVFVCYDLRFADEFWSLAESTDLYVVPANWPKERREHWRVLLRARAVENQAYVLGVNRVGTVKDLEYVGDSAIIDPLGQVLAEASVGETVLTADVGAQIVKEVRAKLPFLPDRRA